MAANNENDKAADTIRLRTVETEAPALDAVTTLAQPPVRKGKKATDKAEKIELSTASKDLEISDRRFRFQKKSLNRIRRMFLRFNVALLIFLTFFALLEKIFPPTASAQHIITDKVIIGIIAGMTAQIGAVVLAAYKGMFTGKKL